METMTSEDLQKDLQQQLSSLAHKHATVSYGLLGILALVLALMTLGGVVAVKYADKALARADAVDAQYRSDKKDWETQRQQLQANIDAASQKQQVVAKAVQNRDQQADQQQKDTFAATDVSEIANNYIKAYQAPISYDKFGIFQLDSDAVKTITATKIDRDRLDADLKDTKQLYDLEVGKFNDSEKQNTTLTTQSARCEKDLAGYQKAAKVSRFKKFLHGAVNVGEVVGGLVLGIEIGKRLPHAAL